VPQEVIALIRKISSANARWGSPRIGGELKKLGIEVAKCIGEINLADR
jgi:putative transposase